MSSHAALPTPLRLEGSLYQIFFSSRDRANRSHVGWIRLDINRPGDILEVSRTYALGPGGPGAFDDSGAMLSWIAEAGGGRQLAYYIGWSLSCTVPFRNAIGLAELKDGKLARIGPGPILDRSLVDPYFTASCCVRVELGLWRMWYLSCSGWDRVDGSLRHRYHIKYAESSDGVSWSPAGKVCIDYADASEYAISRPCVIRDSDCYRMWYSHRGASYRIGYAESPDGFQWARNDGFAGIDVSASGWDSEMIAYPYVFDHDGNRFMLYNGNGYGASGFGLAVLE